MPARALKAAFTLVIGVGVVAICGGGFLYGGFMAVMLWGQIRSRAPTPQDGYCAEADLPGATDAVTCFRVYECDAPDIILVPSKPDGSGAEAEMCADYALGSFSRKNGDLYFTIEPCGVDPLRLECYCNSVSACSPVVFRVLDAGTSRLLLQSE